MPSPEPIKRLLHLGDSYTCSEGVEAGEGWPARFRQALEQAQGRAVEHVHLLAQTGWTSGELLEAFRAFPRQREWDMATLCIGANDQYRDLPMEDYHRNLRELIRLTCEVLVPGNPGLTLCSIPDWGVSPFAADHDRTAVATQIDSFNTSARSVARECGIRWFDWTELSRQFASHPDAFAPDGLHPSAAQHAAWAESFTQFHLGS